MNNLIFAQKCQVHLCSNAAQFKHCRCGFKVCSSHFKNDKNVRWDRVLDTVAIVYPTKSTIKRIKLK
jgi:hypothetical protein